MVDEFNPGDRVDITIRQAAVENADRAWIEVRVRAPRHEPYKFDRFELGIPTDSPDVTVERAMPEAWPPQPGDVWLIGGAPWLLKTDGKFINTAGAEWLPEDALGFCSQPVRVYREVDQ